MMAAQLREDEIVARLAEIVAGTQTHRVLVGIGDDAAVWQPSRSHRSVITTDALVEGIHFTSKTMSPYDVGWRTTIANVSDLAAMGARPVLATIALGAPPGGIESTIDVYRGIAASAKEYGMAVVGGDLTRAPVLTVAMTAVGEVRASNLKLRSGAREGDVIAVTGPLGASRAGLDVARGAVALHPPEREQALAAHRRPIARAREGRWLAASANVRAMMDCSDGLSTDLARLCEASDVGVIVESVPVAACAREAALVLGHDPETYALAGGEEYELVVAVRARAFDRLAQRFYARFGSELVRVGVTRSEREIVRMESGAESPLPRTGWEHFGA